MRFCIESCTLPAPLRVAGIETYTVALRPIALPICSLPDESMPAINPNNRYMPYIATAPAITARTNDVVAGKPELIVAKPVTPKNADAATSVRNDTIANTRLLLE